VANLALHPRKYVRNRSKITEFLSKQATEKPLLLSEKAMLLDFPLTSLVNHVFLLYFSIYQMLNSVSFHAGIFKRITSLTIPIDDIEMMRDVGRLCTELNSVHFIGPLANITDYGRINLNYHDDPAQHSPAVDETIGSILNSWPRV